MTVYFWRAYCDAVLEAEGSRTDHRGSPESLAGQVASELRAAGVPVTVVAVRAIRAARTSGCVGRGCPDDEVMAGGGGGR